MSSVEWALLAVVILGVLPAWLFGVAALIGVRRPRNDAPSARYFAYYQLIERIHAAANNLHEKDFVINNGAAWAATIRELKNYPEYADISLLYLEEFSITGSQKFDHVMKNELNTVEAFLLERRDD